MTALLVGLGAAVGAPARFLLAHALDRRWPTGTLVVNTLGSGLIGLFAALSLDADAWALLATGFCGGLTTYSAFAVQAVERGWREATAYVLATVVLAFGACALGWWLGTLT